MGRQQGRAYQGAEVFLNVYDLSPANDWALHSIGLGIYHSGIELYGNEYSYGGEQQQQHADTSGLFTCTPGQAHGTIKLRARIRLGQTNKNIKQVEQIIAQMRDSYLAKDYNLLNRNCNVFCDSFAKALLDGTGIPPWVNRAASFGRCCPCCFPRSNRNSNFQEAKQEKQFKAFSSKGYRLDADGSMTSPEMSSVVEADEAEIRRKRMADAALKRLERAMASDD